MASASATTNATATVTATATATVSVSASAIAADDSTQPKKRRKIVQDDDGLDRRRAFGQLYEELGSLALNYYFVIPSYYILVMRAFVTLEGIALSADDSFNMYTVAAPFARQKLLNPRTESGRAFLKKALTTPEGRRAMALGLGSGGGQVDPESSRGEKPRTGRVRRVAKRLVGLPWRLTKKLPNLLFRDAPSAEASR